PVSFYRAPSSGSVRLTSSTTSVLGRVENSSTDTFPIDGSPPPQPELTETLHFAQFGGGAGFFSQAILSNLTNSASSVELRMRGQDGQPLTLALDGMGAGGTFELVLSSGEVRIFETASDGALQVGSLTVLSERPLTGVALFGSPFGLAGVAPSQEVSAFQLPVETRGAQVRTGLAVKNLAANQVTLELMLKNSTGATLAVAQQALPAEGQVSLFADEVQWSAPVDFSDFRGQIHAVAIGGNVAATAIQQRPGQLASLPIAKLDD
ncbi:MAG TPA: hypothetical protein VLV83_02475, partial [Acidobacteriota bacterium]|nr:hypothetical protein [Acidobacteriota bacterium]